MKNKILALAFGDPLNPKTYSSVPFFLFSEYKKRKELLGTINTNRNNPFDLLSGSYDFLRSFRDKGRRRNAIWRYKMDNIKKLTNRIQPELKNYQKNHTAIVFGVGAIPKTPYNRVIAHVEISVKAAAEIPEYSRSYGFDRHSPAKIEQASKGEEFFLSKCDKIWTNSNWTRDTFSDYDIPEEKFFVHAPACNIELPDLPEKSWDSPNILFVGKDWERKGGPELVAAFRKIKEKYPFSKLTIIGCSPKIDENSVKVLGFLNRSNTNQNQQLKKAYQQANIFCMPSKWESTGIVYMEAMAYAIPTIMNQGQGRESIFPTETCITLEKGDSDDIFKAILELFTNPKRMKDLSLNGRELIKERYSWKNLSEKLSEL